MKTTEMKVFDIDPLFEVLDYAEKLEKLAVAIYKAKTTKRRNKAFIDLHQLLKDRELVK